jgi:hypothetical protein
MTEIKVSDEQRPGIEILEYHGGPGYDDERLTLENGMSNGLRFLVQDDCDGIPFLAHFHIHDPEVARTIGRKLIEWSDRIANPRAPQR